MLGGKLAARAGRHADHERHAELIARHVAHRRCGIENLVERKQAEIHRHQFDDRAHAGHCGTDAGAGKPRFRQRRIADPFGPEFRQQPFAHRVAAAITADVLAHQKDALVALHCIADRLAHRIAIGDLDRSGLGVSGAMVDRELRGSLRISEAGELLDRLPCSRLGESDRLGDLGSRPRLRCGPGRPR